MHSHLQLIKQLFTTIYSNHNNKAEYYRQSYTDDGFNSRNYVIYNNSDIALTLSLLFLEQDYFTSRSNL